MEMQADYWQNPGTEAGAPEASQNQWRFTEIYEALLDSPDLIEPELVELGRLVAKRLAACQQRRRAATAVRLQAQVEELSAWPG